MERVKSSSRSLPWLFIVLFLGIACTSPRPCLTAKFGTSFKKTVTRISKSLNVPNTLLGIYSRSQSVATLSLLEQEKFEEAKETLAQTALTLGLLDVGGGAALPVAEEIVSYIKKEKGFEPTRKAFADYRKVLSDELTKSADASIDKSAIQGAKDAVKNAINTDVKKFRPLSKVGKAFARASKWFKGASIFDILGPLTDSLTVGINIWGLQVAIKDNNAPGIAAASLSIAAGVVGLTTFVAAVATGSAVLGPIGAVAGAIIGIVATLVELIAGSSNYDPAAVEAYKNRLKQLRNLRDASKEQVDHKMKYLDQVGTPYSDVYVNNQAASLDEVHTIGVYCLTFAESALNKEPNFPYKTSIVQRRYISKKEILFPDLKKEITEEPYLCIGGYSGIHSPIMPMKTQTGLGIAFGKVGFDFYGKFKKGTSYGGVYVFVTSDFVSEEMLRPVKIDTATHIPEDIAQNDVISISDYQKIKKKTTDTYLVIVKTGRGNDSLNINGMIGEFNEKSANILNADLGDGKDVLSFQGMTKDREDIRGIFFDSKAYTLKYYHGTNRNIHRLGIVQSVELFVGSPFDDHVVFYSNGFQVIQPSGSNVYEFNCDDLATLDSSTPRQFQITDHSAQPPKLNLYTTGSSRITMNDVVLQRKTLKVYDTTGSSPRVLFEVLLETKTTANLFINNANPRRIIPVLQISPVLINGEFIVDDLTRRDREFREGDKNDLLLLKWETRQGKLNGMGNIYMKGGVDYVVISERHLLEPLGIDGESLTLTCRWGALPFGGKHTRPFKISIRKRDDIHSGYFWLMFDAEKVINEYGDELIDIPTFQTPRYELEVDLYERYFQISRSSLGVNTVEDALTE